MSESQYPTITGEAILRHGNSAKKSPSLRFHLDLRPVSRHGYSSRCAKVRDTSRDVSTPSHVSAGDVARFASVAHAEDTFRAVIKTTVGWDIVEIILLGCPRKLVNG